MDINDVRKTLDQVWLNVQAKGRCWGKQNTINPLAGSHITFLDQNEVVTIHPKDNNFEIFEYKRTEGTTLGAEIKQILKKNNIRFL